MVLRLSEAVVRTILATPPIRRVVPDSVFDAFGWCPSDTLEWRRSDAWTRPAHGTSVEVTEANPPGMVFVMREACEFLPRELARLHAPGIGLSDEWALAPYGIDDASDELYARRVVPGSLLWLFARDLAGLVWGLHDWAHFHNHGPFEARALTELQCDVAALVWLWLNRSAVGIDDATWERARLALSGVALGRFSEEGVPFPVDCLSAERLVAVAETAPLAPG
jgi:hypothetical protein